MFLSELKLKSSIPNGTHKSVSLISVNGTVEKEMQYRFIIDAAIADRIQ